MAHPEPHHPDTPHATTHATPPGQTDITPLRRLVAQYARYAARGYTKHGRPTSSNAVLRAACKHLLAFDDLADRPAHQFTRADLENLCHDLANRDDKPIAVSTVNTYRQKIITMFAWAEEEDLVPRDLPARLDRARTIKPGRTKAKPPRKVHAADHDAIFGVCADLRRRAEKSKRYAKTYRLHAIAFELAWEIGARPGEIVQMRPRDVTTDPKTPGRRLYTPPEWKTEHEDARPRILLLSQRAGQLVEEAVAVNAADKRGQNQFRFASDYSPDHRLFPWRSENLHHAEGSFRQALTRALRHAGYPRQVPNQLRHAFATRAAAVDLEGARVQLGHKSIKTTMHYLDDDGPAVRNLFDRLDGDASPDNPPDPAAPAAPPLKLAEG